jgi:hypothetical protein
MANVARISKRFGGADFSDALKSWAGLEETKKAA